MNEWRDRSVRRNVTYQHRVKAQNSTGESASTNSAIITISNTELPQYPYFDNPLELPGVIEAEYFDKGG